MKQICLLGLWKAVITFKNDKKIAFSTYAYIVIKSQVNYYLRSNRKYFTNISLSHEFTDNLTIEDTISDPYDRIEELENKIDNETLIHKISSASLKENERKTFELYMQGLTQVQIAKVIGISQPQVSRYLKSIRRYYGKTYN